MKWSFNHWSIFENIFYLWLSICYRGKGADLFICDLANTIIDFNSAEDDRKAGQCRVVDKSTTSAEIPK